MGEVIRLPLPPRWALMYRLRCLVMEAGITDRWKWASDLVQRPITSFRQLTSEEIEWLIAWLVIEGSEAKPCRSACRGRYCIHNWPGHPLMCTDVFGNEWLAREI
jgi:hypothetical protein